MRFLIFLAVLLGAAALWAQAYLEHFHPEAAPGQRARDARFSKQVACRELLGATGQLQRHLEGVEERVALTVKIVREREAQYSTDDEIDEVAIAISVRAGYLREFAQSAYQLSDLVDYRYLSFAEDESDALGFDAIRALPSFMLDRVGYPHDLETFSDEEGFNNSVSILREFVSKRADIEAICRPILTP